MRVVIANRGEVAVRIIRACQELGHTSILLHSTADKNTLGYRLADEVLELPGETAQQTYLNIPLVIEKSLEAKAHLLHPGFGFLSENADFVAELEKTNIKFVGPSSKVIRVAGNKIKAKEMALKAGVPVTPAFTGATEDPQVFLAEARQIGFPCMIKAASGGGGKGMKVAWQESEFLELLASAQREAKAAFGSSVVFLEKFLDKPRHVEVQIFGDKHENRVHFFERECSIQRRHQKVFEETPAFSIKESLAAKITEAALQIAKACNYTNAGTVEFLVDSNDKFYFMELNTRLQVEHTVTEMVCGIDLVHLQFLAAQGILLPLKQEQISQRGHALEVRLCAESPEREFLPSIGKLELVSLPYGPQRRFDFGFETGDTITPHYDSMIGKVITWAPTRKENIARMLATLSETVIFGVQTNIEFLKSVLQNPKFAAGPINTHFIEETYQNKFSAKPLTPQQIKFAEEQLKLTKAPSTSSGSPAVKASPWTEISFERGGI